MNPFKRFYDYFTAKSVKQRVYIIIAFTLLLIFAAFAVKGVFLNSGGAEKSTSANSGTSIGGTSDDSSQAEGNNDSDTETKTVQTQDLKFRISIVDMIVLLVVITFFVIKKLGEKRKHRRM